jgi:hypothetical protein
MATNTIFVSSEQVEAAIEVIDGVSDQLAVAADSDEPGGVLELEVDIDELRGALAVLTVASMSAVETAIAKEQGSND